MPQSKLTIRFDICKCCGGKLSLTIINENELYWGCGRKKYSIGCIRNEKCNSKDCILVINENLKKQRIKYIKMLRNIVLNIIKNYGEIFFDIDCPDLLFSIKDLTKNKNYIYEKEFMYSHYYQDTMLSVLKLKKGL